MDWKQLTDMACGEPFVIERVRFPSEDIAVEGRFEPPELAMLPADEQVFVAAFVRCHGNLRQMQELFGISYPTVKNRLNRIGEKLTVIETNPPAAKSEVLRRLEAGEIDVAEALRRLEG
jgi:hypothetical protein